MFLRNCRTCYFFAYDPWAKEAEFIDAFYQLSLKAFNEDGTNDRGAAEEHQHVAGIEDADHRHRPRRIPVQKNDGRDDAGRETKRSRDSRCGRLIVSEVQCWHLRL
jgi:hypothetical protein